MALISTFLLAAASTHAHPGMCDAKPIQFLIGKPASTKNKALAKARSHSEFVREVAVDGIMTMDYSPHRLNIIIGKNGQIARLDCG